MVDTYDGKKTFGSTANNSAKPPVNPKLIKKSFLRSFMIAGVATTSFKASIANKGMVNSAITRMEDTARNLLYIGT